MCLFVEKVAGPLKNYPDLGSSRGQPGPQRGILFVLLCHLRPES